MRSHKQVGLALSGGAARGLAHIGVLMALEKNNIPVDIIAGTSAGSVAGAAYANNIKPDAIKEMAISMGLRDWASLADIRLPHGGFIAGNRLIALLKTIVGDVDFNDLKIPFACIACDLDTGEEVVLNKGSVLKAVRASISIPVIFSVVKQDNRYLVDGGLINQVPVNVVKSMGADVVIAVNVIPLAGQKQKLGQKTLKDKGPGVFDVMMSVLDIANKRTVLESMEGADVVINPNTSGFKPADFNLAKELILEGEMAGEMAIPEIELALRA